MASVPSSSSSPPSLLPLPPAAPSFSPPPATTPQIKSDVFLSFRGEDTRDKFTSHLHKALRDKKIVTFIDDKLDRGDEISSVLLKAIEESEIAIIIFSKDYASSRWCLKELVKILECRENHGQTVIPVFYEIDPSHVRNQTGSYAVAFAKHEQRFEESLDEVQKWRRALKDVADLCGFDSRVVKPESALIEEIVQRVLKDLKRQNNVSPYVNKKLVGIESRIKVVESYLGTEGQIHYDVRSVGIWGMGGIGKTTLAKAVCEKISGQFEGFHFVKNVREAFDKKESKCLRKELFLAILRDESVYNDQLMRKRFSRMKLLIILDDVSSFDQVEDLIGDLDFGRGSRVIITSRNQQVLKNFGVNYIHEVEELSFDDALKLFCRYAFKQNHHEEDYKGLSKGLVEKVGGVPLALKVLGSFLLGKEKEVWESSMKKLEKILDKDIHEVLKISYDGLDDDQQRIFLHIACFFKGWNVNPAKAIMDACGFFTANGISALKEKCLIKEEGWVGQPGHYKVIMMHDLLQAMGKTVVRQESLDPGKQTRLWDHHDICDVLTKATGTKTIEGISLNLSNIGDICLHPCAFANMPNLRFLRFYISDCYNYKVHVPQDTKLLLPELRYFEWERCPLKSLQSNFHLKNLVILKLHYSDVEQLWNCAQQFDHLEQIDLGWSENLVRFPDFRAPKLERLSLNGCTSLIEMPLSFQHLSRLMNLSLYACENLASVPQFPNSLQLVNLSSCSMLERLPDLPNNLKRLHLSGCSSLIEIPPIQHLTRLYFLDLSDCISLTNIPDCTGLISLHYLHLPIAQNSRGH